MKFLNKLMFEARHLFYGFVMGILLNFVGIFGLLGLTVLAVVAPIIFWLDNKYIKPLM